MDYHRLSNRSSTIYYSEVLDADSGEVIGRLASLSDNGLLLIAVRDLQPGSILELRLHLPLAIAGRTEFDCRAEVRWCHADVNPDHLAAGLEFRDLTEKQVSFLKTARSQICFEKY